MTLKEKTVDTPIFIKLLVVSIITLGVAVALTYVGMHFADLAGLADVKSMTEFFYGVGTLVIGIFCFVAYTGAAGTFGFTLFLWFNPDLDDSGSK